MFRRLSQNKVLCNDNLQGLLPDAHDYVYADTSAEHIAQVLGTDVGTALSLMGLFKKVELASMSTSYSGIDAPGVSVMSIIAYAQQELDLTVNHPDHVFAIEWNHHCQQELLEHPACPSCLFGDLEEFLCPLLRGQLPELLRSQKLQSVLEPVIMDQPSKAVATCLSLYIANTQFAVTLGLLCICAGCLAFV